MLRRKTLAAGALVAGCLLAAQGAAAAPTGDVSARLQGGTLTVRGGDDVDLVDVRARGLAIEVAVGDASAGRFPLWAVRRIRVETGAGDDRVTLDDGPLALLRFTPVTSTAATATTWRRRAARRAGRTWTSTPTAATRCSTATGTTPGSGSGRPSS